MLWFDVEKRYLTTVIQRRLITVQLWFDVEKRYLTTPRLELNTLTKLWFDVEKRYLTTQVFQQDHRKSCGLM